MKIRIDSIFVLLLSALFFIAARQLLAGTETTAQQAALTILDETEQLDKPAKEALMEAVRQLPKERRWSVMEGGKIYAIVAAPIPEEDADRIALQVLRVAELRAVNELFLSKELLDRYKAIGLDDVAVLKQSIQSASSPRSFRGVTGLVTKMSVVVDGWGIALAFVGEEGFVGKLTDDSGLEDIRNAYRDILHEMMKKSMTAGDWDGAIKKWKQCQERSLFAPDLFIDAAKIEMERKNETAALAVLQTAFEKYRNHTDDHFFETVGKISESIEKPEAQSLAKESYQRAISLILSGNRTP